MKIEYKTPFRKYTNGYEAWNIECHPQSEFLRSVNNVLCALPGEIIVIMHHGIVVLYVKDLRNLDELEKEMGLTQCHKEGEVTLNDLKARKINPETQAMFERTMELWHGNILVHQRRMAMEEEREYEAMNMTHDGNDPKSSEQMLDDARMYIEKHVYTDEQWERYLPPAINKMLEYNANFERWYPGYLIRKKDSSEMAIVEYDYATAFGHLCGRECRNFTDLSLCLLDAKKNITGTIAWRDYSGYELMDKCHTEEYIAKIRAWYKKHNSQPPYYLSDKMINLFYR